MRLNCGIRPRDQIIRKMKVTVFLLTISILGTFASGTYSQTTKLTLQFDNTALEKVLGEIENQSEFRFFYNENVNVRKEVTVSSQNESVFEILDYILGGTGIKYRIIGRQIALYNQDESFNPAAISSGIQIQVQGRVTDSSGTPLPGVTVAVKNTTKGTISDANGNYSLSNVPGDAMLVFSFVGMKTQEIMIAGKTNISVVMQEETVGIEEVVAVGYGTVKRSNISGSVSSVSVKDIPKDGAVSIGTALKGRAAGLNITQSTAQPGGAISMSIRGSITGRAPLIVVDGIPQTSFGQPSSGTIYTTGAKDRNLIALNPNDIESIDILKDASAAAIYGSDAAGGVILITTKKGSKTQKGFDIDINSSATFQTLSDYPSYFTAREFMIEENKIYEEIGRGNEKPHSQDKIDNFVGDGTKWIDEITRTGIIQDHNISIRGASDKTNYFTSVGYLGQDAVLKNSDLRKITIRTNLDYKLGRMLKTGLYSTVAILNSNDLPLGEKRNNQASVLYSAMKFNPTVPVYDTEGNFSVNPERDVYPNPVSLLGITNEAKNNALMITGYIEANPVKNLTIKATLGLDRKTNQSDQYVPTSTRYGFEKNGIASKANANNQMMLGSIIANYNLTLNDTHLLDLMLGGEYKKQNSDGMSISAYDFPYDGALMNNIDLTQMDRPAIGSYKSSGEMQSVVGRVNYSFINRYIATFNFRVDGSSNFAKAKQYGFFPGVSAGWRISQEPFMQRHKWLNELKLRAGAGVTGNASNLSGIYDYYRIYANQVVLGGRPQNVARYAQLGNPNLTWESLVDYSLGIDFSVLDNRLSGSVDSYLRYEYDKINQKTLMSYQELNSIDYNSDNVYRTTGIDVNLSYRNVNNRKFTWKTDLTLSFYENYTVKRDAEFNPLIYQTYREKWGNIWAYKSDGLIQEGETVPHQPGAQPGSIKYLDINSFMVNAHGDKVRDTEGYYIYLNEPDGKLDEADKVLVGNSTPLPFGINSTFTYKGFDLNIYFYGILNSYRFNEWLNDAIIGMSNMQFGENALTVIKDRWTPSNSDAKIPGVSELSSGTNPSQGDYFYEKDAFIRFDNLTLGYTVPNRMYEDHLKQLRIFVSARNLFYITSFRGMDPETGRGLGAYPNQRSFIIGADIKF